MVSAMMAFLEISYDMGWQKRGMLGTLGQDQGTAAGRATGKIIHFETRNTTCRICENVAT